jgi:hypothetical protein
MQASPDLFRKSLDQWVEKAGGKLDALARVSCQDLSEAVIDDTRVDTGFLVGNWQPSLNAPTLSVDEVGTGNGYAQSKTGVVIAQIKAGDVYYFVNNAAYARRREYGFVGADSLGRVYNEPGDHMITMNIARWDAIVARAAVKIGLAA